MSNRLAHFADASRARDCVGVSRYDAICRVAEIKHAGGASWLGGPPGLEPGFLILEHGSLRLRHGSLILEHVSLKLEHGSLKLKHGSL